MLIYFENQPYPADQILPYLDGLGILKYNVDKTKYWTESIGYIFINNEDESYPVFILPKAFLIEETKDRMNVLGMKGIYPEDVIDTDSEDNPLEISGKGSFLPELGIWLFRALNRFRLENADTNIGKEANLDAQMPEEDSRDKDFLSTALELIDFLKDHRSLFTQISLINHSGRNRIDWPKTVTGDPFFENGEPWYLDPAIKDKTINIDEELIILYYSVLKYLRDKYKFPVNLGEVPYALLSPSEVQRLIDTGIGSKTMRRIRHKYFRDDLKHLWGLLDSFFTYNSSDEDKEKRKEQLLVKNFEIVFESMIDRLISDPQGVEDLKDQKDGKLIDHIFRYTSLFGGKSEIYYIGDSKYYKDTNRPEGVALYKQFTYAKNTIQYHIDHIYLTGLDGQTNLRYRDTLTESYNISPNFFIRARVKKEDIDFDRPTIRLTYWDREKNQQFPPSNKHFQDRLFDRDTLVLREFSINLLFVIAAYAGYEDNWWHSEIHDTIRRDFIKSIDQEYEFFIIHPENDNILAFWQLYYEFIKGKVNLIAEGDNFLVIAFERNQQGEQDRLALLAHDLYNSTSGQKFDFTLTHTTLADISNL